MKKIISIFLFLIFLNCEYINEGVVIKKEVIPEHNEILTKSGFVDINTNAFYITIQKLKNNGKTVNKSVRVGETLYDNISIGDNYVSQ